MIQREVRVYDLHTDEVLVFRRMSVEAALRTAAERYFGRNAPIRTYKHKRHTVKTICGVLQTIDRGR